MNWTAFILFSFFFLLFFGPAIPFLLELLGVKWAKRFVARREKIWRILYGRGGV